MTPMKGLLDTSFFVADESGRGLDHTKVPRAGAVSVVTIGELRLGVLTARTADVRATRLSTLVDAMELDPLPIDHAVAEAWAMLRIRMKEAGVAIPVNDSWMAATALAHGIPVVTRDGDFADGLGIDIIRV